MMFGYKSFIKLGMLDDSSIMGLYNDSYELDRCTYSFSQGINSDGKAQTDVRGGAINLTIPGIPPEDIISDVNTANSIQTGRTEFTPLPLDRQLVNQNLAGFLDKARMVDFEIHN